MYDIIDDSALTRLTSTCERHQELKAVSAWHCEERLRWVRTHAHTYAHTHIQCVREMAHAAHHVRCCCAQTDSGRAEPSFEKGRQT